MRSIAVVLLSLMAAATAEQISITCQDLVLDPATDVLSGKCNDGQGDHAAFQKTSLDLNTCLVYNASQAQILVGGKHTRRVQVADGN